MRGLLAAGKDDVADDNDAIGDNNGGGDEYDNGVFPFD